MRAVTGGEQKLRQTFPLPEPTKQAAGEILRSFSLEVCKEGVGPYVGDAGEGIPALAIGQGSLRDFSFRAWGLHVAMATAPDCTEVRDGISALRKVGPQDTLNSVS